MEECENDPRTRTLDVTLQGGAPWGFSVKGGSEHRCPLTIARIEPGGKASQSGALQVDDIILSINSVECEAHTEAIQLVKGSPDTLQLIIQRFVGPSVHLSGC
ncbi:protein Shroom2-like [Patiria miniata]|uniref:PDZ domain-containing protein n=1 Tax=Patiria miniata TaxID=46514 RepID=A0A914A2E0_PATMI|nr:protein Shroom2-like [Patiria miniata]